MPRETLTREQIIRTAVELLDDEGLEGLNMRSLGDRLGSAATAVYWHVKNKDELVVLAADRVWGEIELPDLEAVDWRTAALAMARDLYAMVNRHPWLVLAMGTHLLYGPGKARHDDHSLALYEKAGFSGEDADRAMASVFMFVLGSALGGSAGIALSRRLRREGGNAQERLRETVAQASDIAMKFPRLRARVEAAAQSDYASAPHDSFDYGLQALLDGLELQLTVDLPHGQAQTPAAR